MQIAYLQRMDGLKAAMKIKEEYPNKSVSGKSSVELNREANSDIYRMFSNLDVSSREKFVSSFEKVATQEDFDKFLSTGRFWSMNNL